MVKARNMVCFGRTLNRGLARQHWLDNMVCHTGGMCCDAMGSQPEIVNRLSRCRSRPYDILEDIFFDQGAGLFDGGFIHGGYIKGRVLIY